MMLRRRSLRLGGMVSTMASASASASASATATATPTVTPTTPSSPLPPSPSSVLPDQSSIDTSVSVSIFDQLEACAFQTPSKRPKHHGPNHIETTQLQQRQRQAGQVQKQQTKKVQKPKLTTPRIYTLPPNIPSPQEIQDNIYPPPHTLILGSMVSPMGLQKGECYAHPQNHYYRILGRLLQFDHTLPYIDRLQAMLKKGVCMWNVLASCVRSGALDSAIKQPVSNRIDDVVKQYPTITLIGLNGGYAYTHFMKFVLKEQPYLQQLIDEKKLRVVRLISSSPACAMPNGLATKTKLWAEQLEWPYQIAKYTSK